MLQCGQTESEERTFLADSSSFAGWAAAGELLPVVLAGATVQAGVGVAGPRGFLGGGGLASGLPPGGGGEGKGGSLGAHSSHHLGAGSAREVLAQDVGGGGSGSRGVPPRGGGCHGGGCGCGHSGGEEPGDPVWKMQAEAAALPPSLGAGKAARPFGASWQQRGLDRWLSQAGVCPQDRASPPLHSAGPRAPALHLRATQLHAQRVSAVEEPACPFERPNGERGADRRQRGLTKVHEFDVLLLRLLHQNGRLLGSFDLLQQGRLDVSCRVGRG